MREALGSLTTRGQAFLASGITLVVAGFLVGQDAVIRAGVVVGVLPVLAAWWLSRSRHDLTLQRRVSPSQVAVGQTATVDLVLTNRGEQAAGTLLLDEQVPYVLGTPPRFLLEGVERGAEHERHFSYAVRSDVRGQFEIGPARMRVGDPFGLVELGLVFSSTVRLTVTPQVVPLPVIPLGGARSGSGDQRPRAFTTGSAEDVTVREYRRGDDLRRVHWRSSARTGELMVRREEQPWHSRATVFLDTRAQAHRGLGAASSLEAAVSAAASLATHLTQQGWTVRLVTAAGESHETEWHTHSAGASAAPLLEALAVVRPARLGTPHTQWMAEAGQGGLTVGIFGALHDSDLAFLHRLRHHSGTTLAVALDVDGWNPHRSGARSQGPQVLARAGWRSTVLGSQDRLAMAWQSLGAATYAAREAT